jgi:hypothetical protein
MPKMSPYSVKRCENITAPLYRVRWAIGRRGSPAKCLPSCSERPDALLDLECVELAGTQYEPVILDGWTAQLAASDTGCE